ncbi:hypothetical protein EJ05DRAFT_508765 [Pseudovirgaria hyperparasitica]|uniref:Uncharacterized protein n=1 Tax=Pseudovirgaria hyperparasitica TaxID=470096 RepID=A0A6A6WBY1_9PEZI|nr:uncharacterized protein EJ05DRAFT_508765 [Pseudovirgaria hyperparasitica]KAF2760203.1 hypothetical protein EJ05DRAFT_508765 [Pseudovirgaria hyperparasitica]
MGDPISVAGLIIAIGQVTACLIDYGKNVAHAADDVARLSQELFSLQGALEYLQTDANSRVSSGTSPFQMTPSFDEQKFSEMVTMTQSFLQSLLKDLEEPRKRVARLMKRLEWPLKRTDVDKHFARLERAKTWFVLVLTTESSGLVREIHSSMEVLCATLEQDLHERRQVRTTHENTAMLSWLCPVSYTTTHKQIREGRRYDAGQWFMQGPLTQFLSNPTSCSLIMVLKGKSGSGKSTLCSSIVDHFTHTQEGIRLAYFYCSGSSLDSQQTVHIMGSFLAQLCQADEAIHDRIRSDYLTATAKSSGSEPRAPTLTYVEDALVACCKILGPTFLLLDAINESVRSDEIIESISRIVSQTQHVRIVMTSTSDEQHKFWHSQQAPIRTVLMDPMLVFRDIQAHTELELASNPILHKLKPELRTDIMNSICANADGSFRWAQLTLSHLTSQRTGKAMRNALRDLPRTLKEIYANILTRISPEDSRYVQELLLWVAFAERPMKLDELTEAVIITECEGVLDEDSRFLSLDEIIRKCYGLLHVDKGTVTLSHASVKAFLTSDWLASSYINTFYLDPKQADTLIMRRCLEYLTFQNFLPGYRFGPHVLHNLVANYALLPYVALRWAQHGVTSTLEKSDLAMILKFLNTRSLPNGGNFGTWIQLLLPEAQPHTLANTQPLYYAASFGLTQVVKAILAADPTQKIDAKGGRHNSTALFIACYRGYAETAGVLLRGGANPRILDACGESPISWAESYGPLELRKLMRDWIAHNPSRSLTASETVVAMRTRQLPTPD